MPEATAKGVGNVGVAGSHVAVTGTNRLAQATIMADDCAQSWSRSSFSTFRTHPIAQAYPLEGASTATWLGSKRFPLGIAREFIMSR